MTQLLLTNVIITVNITIEPFNELLVEDVESISIVSIFHEPLVGAKSFPSLFPNGDHTYDVNRDARISRCDYYEARIFVADARFAANTNCIFFGQYAYECEKLFSSLSINFKGKVLMYAKAIKRCYLTLST